MDDYNDDIEHYALYKAINDIPIKYAIYNYSQIAEDIEKDSKIASELITKAKEEELSQIIKKSFYIWFNDTLKMIQEDGRSREFADIKNILLDKIKLQKVSINDDYDLSFFFVHPYTMKEYCGEDAGGCIYIKWKTPAVIIVDPSFYKNPQNSLAVTLHEVGHYFALGDQYENFDNNSLVHSTKNERIGNHDSVMASNYEINLSCDDVDGFINLIDLTLALENDGIFNKRAQKSWASFCNDKTNQYGQEYEDVFYQNAKIKYIPVRIL